MSGIDNAIWDIMGKAVGKPVPKLLGGSYRKEIPAYISMTASRALTFSMAKVTSAE